MYFIPGVRTSPFHTFHEGADGIGDGAFNTSNGGLGAGYDNGDGDGCGAGWGDGEGDGDGEGVWLFSPSSACGE